MDESQEGPHGETLNGTVNVPSEDPGGDEGGDGLTLGDVQLINRSDEDGGVEVELGHKESDDSSSRV